MSNLTCIPDKNFQPEQFGKLNSVHNLVVSQMPGEAVESLASMFCVKCDYKYIYVVCTSTPLSAGGAGVEPPTKFSKRGDLAGPQLLEGVAWRG